jgi:hypothetical protein
VPRKIVPLEQRFWAKVTKTEDCWLWDGYIASTGYGQIGSGPRKDKVALSTHRLSWQLAHGPIPDTLFVLHKCDVRRCVNPSHLFLGTAADNAADMVAKNRQAKGVGSKPRKVKSNQES